MNERTHSEFRLSKLCWIVVFVVLVVGVIVGYMARGMGGQPTGDCVSSDSTIVASNVTLAECQSRCPDCDWIYHGLE